MQISSQEKQKKKLQEKRNEFAWIFIPPPDSSQIDKIDTVDKIKFGAKTLAQKFRAHARKFPSQPTFPFAKLWHRNKAQISNNTLNKLVVVVVDFVGGGLSCQRVLRRHNLARHFAYCLWH